jgi:hypothetical protein
MADATPANGRPRQQNEQGESTFQNLLGVVQKAVFFYLVSRMITNYFAPTSPAQQSPANLGEPQTSGVPTANTIPQSAYPLWPLGTPLDLHVFITTSPNPYDVFAQRRKRHEEAMPEFSWKDITVGNWKEERDWEGVIHPPPSVLRNQSAIYAQIFVAANHTSPDPFSAEFNPDLVYPVTKLLTHLKPRRKIRKEKSLLSSNTDTEDEEEVTDDGLEVPYWYPNLTLNLVSDNQKIQTQMPPVLAEHVRMIPSSNPQSAFYFPILLPNDFWHLQSHYQPLLLANASIPLRVNFYPISQLKFQAYASMTHSFQQAAKQQGSAGAAELDELKRMLVETNPILLTVTAIVSVLHMVFEMLAFSSDVSHWRKKDELVGVSLRTIITNVFVQLVILLYLVDNNQDTSWMILFGQGTGMLIECWKITKVVNINLTSAPAGSLLPYKITITDKHELSEDEKKTQEYDKLAFRYVSYVAIPLLVGYTIYSLIYESHRGWYSFTISTLTSFVYAFGFAQLVPQLVINYKLKSVAHMPMKAMVYKTLSTVVDDFFAFCIKMPILHRLACFRDDVVFLIFLYQRYIYRIDPNRVNEYGQVLDDKQKEKVQLEEEKRTKLKAKAKEVQKPKTAELTVEKKKTK